MAFGLPSAKTIGLIIVVICIIFLVSVVYNDAKDSLTEGAEIGGSTYVLNKACEQDLPSCDFKYCPEENEKCTEKEKEQWKELVVYLGDKDCESKEAKCDALQKKIFEINRAPVYNSIEQIVLPNEILPVLVKDAEEQYIKSIPKTIESKDYVEAAFNEYIKWKEGKLKETDKEAKSYLDLYWKNVGWSTYNPSRDPWSAAFISYVITEFNSASHSGYINQVYGEKIKGWKFYDPNEKELSVGDVVCSGRDGAKFDPNNYYKSHCDIVYKIEGNKAIVIGGNVGNSVTARTISLNDNKVDSNVYFAVLSKVT